MIAAVYHAENQLQDLAPEERKEKRNDKVRPLVDAFFAWIHATASDKTLYVSDMTRKGLNYCLNQEEYLKVFLEDGEIAIDNNQTLSEGITYPHLFPDSVIAGGFPEKRCA